MSRTTAMRSNMFGVTEVPETIESVERERRKRSTVNVNNLKCPDLLKESKEKDPDTEKSNIVLKQINELFKANNYQPIPFYKLIIDPHSFTNTVQNTFQLSFLVRNGDLSLDVGSDSYPEVHYVPPAENKKQFKATQAICSLSVDICNVKFTYFFKLSFNKHLSNVIYFLRNFPGDGRILQY